ncbi:MAG TPA: FAD-containing oxidoreductase [Bryobacteraceae bacterium]|nr:FAD-containing oxidoreductase [Bryobacteraceae bacterium]
MPRFDAIVIGTGQAGPSLAARLSAAGQRVAIVERGRFGGTCVNTGCIPTKTLVASAYVAHTARRAREYGVLAPGPVAVDMKLVKQRKDEISGKSRNGVESWLKGLSHCAVYEAHARFESPHEIRAGDEILSADRIFLNVGARATIPALSGVEHTPYLTNASILELETLPRHLIVIGGGAVGLEFGQIFRRFGSEVTIVERASRLVPREDDDISSMVLEILRAEGIHVRLDATCIALRRDEEGVAVRLDCTEGAPEVRGSHILLAMGRTPNTNDLGLEKAGVKCDSKGYIVVSDELLTNIPGIWALGDCNGRGGFTHTSYNDFEIVAANLLDHESRRVSDRITAYNLYIDPPLGRAGMTESEARSSGRRVLVARRPMTRVGRAVEKGETQGAMKILVDADSKQIVGAAILGTGGDEVIHCILDVMYSLAPYTVLQRAMHIHPTVSELIPTMLGDLQPLAS